MAEIDEVVCPNCRARLAVRFDKDAWRVTCMSCESSFDLEEAVRDRLKKNQHRRVVVNTCA
jgi:hypothetical protein